MKAIIPELLLFLSLVSQPLYADVELFSGVGRNGGEYVYELSTGRYGITPQGSRVRYELDYPYYYAGGIWSEDHWKLSLKIETSLGYLNSGRATDEDFYFSPAAKENFNGVNTARWQYLDTAYLIDESENFSISVADSYASHTGVETTFTYFPFYAETGLYLSAGLRYRELDLSFYKNYYMEMDPPWAIYSPAGIDLMNYMYEIPLGVGYRAVIADSLVWDTGFQAAYGRDYSHLFLKSRYLFVTGRNSAHTLRLSTALEYGLTQSLTIGAGFEAYRFFSYSVSSRASLGYTPSDLWLAKYNYGGGTNAYINTKESRVELRASYRFRTGDADRNLEEFTEDTGGQQMQIGK